MPALPRARRRRRSSASCAGIGIGCYLEIAGAFPEEPARITFPGNGQVAVSIGAGASGQGHRTVFGSLAARRLGLSPAQVTVTAGDSERDVPGFGAVASRSAMYVGNAVAAAADAALAKGQESRRHAAAGRGRRGRLPRRQVRREEPRGLAVRGGRARGRARRQGVIPESLDSTAKVKLPSSFPNGCHVAEVEIDPETGAIEIVSYVAVGDCGNVLDETIVTGQVHGGVAQGLGQALCENTVYDTAGQLVSGSFMDYALPRADSVPPMLVEHFAVACRSNALGVKGTGEAGTTAAPPALINAILDALPKGAALDMPATAERIWQALKAAQ